jgi:hypothetical protein
MARLLSFRRALSPSAPIGFTQIGWALIALLLGAGAVPLSARQTPEPAVDEAPAAADPIEQYQEDPFDAADPGEPMVDEGRGWSKGARQAAVVTRAPAADRHEAQP